MNHAASNTAVPMSLFHAGRAQCPDCGAALALVDNKPLVRCGYCGGTSGVERRLRTIQPVIDASFVTADAPESRVREVKPSHVLAGVAEDESHCPTCGNDLGVTEGDAIRTCGYCKTQSKVERRLVRSADIEEALAAMDQKDDRRLDETEALIVKATSDGDLAERVRAARELGEMWIHVNARAARLLPRILETMKKAEPPLEHALENIVGKLLCSDEVIFANAVLRAAEKVVFDLKGSTSLLRALGLGSGVGLKLLLDAANYAANRGGNLYACYALWSVNTMIERNYAGRMRLAEVVLYRLLYLRGPVQGWALELVRGQLGLGCRFATPTLLRFIDDCAVERPELEPYIERCFYEGEMADEAAYVERMKLIEGLYTEAAKRAGWRQLGEPREEFSEAVKAKYEAERKKYGGDGAAAALDGKLEEWRRMWDEGIREAVGDYEKRREEAKGVWEKVGHGHPR